MMEKRNSHVEDRIQAMLDGELNDREALPVREHCDVCSSCRGALEESLAVREMLSRDASPRMLRPVWPEMANRLSGKGPTGNRRTFALATAVAILLGLSLGLFIGAPSRTAQTESDLWSHVGSTLTGDSSTLSSAYIGGFETEGEPAR